MLKDKDISQRTFGFISFSFLTHTGLIAGLFLIPNMLKVSSGSNKTETYLVEASIPASLGESAQALPAMPPQIELPAKKTAAPAREKAVAATNKVLSLPPKKSAPAKVAAKIQTVDQSEVEVNQALKASRETEERPEVAADIEVPEVNEQAQVESEEQTPEASETVESATTSSSDSATEPSTEESAQAAPAQEQPLIAPISRGAQLSSPAGQVGGLGTVGAAAPTTGSGNSTNGGAVRDADSLKEQAGNAKPSYADDDQRAGHQGVVVFDATVTREGLVQAIEMKQSSGHSSLDSSAYEAFKKHRYLPGQQGSVRKKFQFVLNGEQESKSRLRRR